MNGKNHVTMQVVEHLYFPSSLGKLCDKMAAHKCNIVLDHYYVHFSSTIKANISKKIIYVAHISKQI